MRAYQSCTKMVHIVAGPVSIHSLSICLGVTHSTYLLHLHRANCTTVCSVIQTLPLIDVCAWDYVLVLLHDDYFLTSISTKLWAHSIKGSLS